MEFKDHRYKLPAGQVITNQFQSQEDVFVQLGTYAVKFENTPADPEDPSETIVDITTNNNGMRVSLNQHNNSTFEFYDKDAGAPVVTVEPDNLNIHEHKIMNVGNPVNALDAANKQYVQQFDLPVGTILAFYGVNPPPYYFVANGSTFDQTEYPDLYNVLGSNVLPDLRGLFIRSYDPTNIRDPDARAIGSVQQDQFESHQHSYVDRYASNSGSYVGIEQGGGYLKDQIATTFNTGLTGGNNETRPVNMCLSHIIKAKKINLFGEY